MSRRPWSPGGDSRPFWTYCERKHFRWAELTGETRSSRHYLPFASFIHCSRTGLIFWALLGVMSSFSNLEGGNRDQTLAPCSLFQQRYNTTSAYQRFIKRDCIQRKVVVANARTFFWALVEKKPPFELCNLAILLLFDSWFIHRNNFNAMPWSFISCFAIFSFAPAADGNENKKND